MPHLTDCGYYEMRDEARLSNVQCHLESSKYHIPPAPGQQVKQYLSQGPPGVHPHSHPGQPLAAVPVMRNGHMAPPSDGSTPGSPVTLLTLTSGHESEFPMDEVIDDLISLESGFNEESLGCMQSNIIMQNNVSLSGAMMDLYSSDQERNTRVLAKERQKKDNHNLTIGPSPVTHVASWTLDISGDLQRSTAPPSGAPAADHAGGPAAFSDPLSHFTDFFGATLKDERRMDRILMDGPLSPFGDDPLLSTASPDESKGSSRRSSFSTDEDDAP